MPERFCTKQNENAFFCTFCLNSDDVVAPLFQAKWKTSCIRAACLGVTCKMEVDVLRSRQFQVSVPLLRNRPHLSLSVAFAPPVRYLCGVRPDCSPLHTHRTVWRSLDVAVCLSLSLLKPYVGLWAWSFPCIHTPRPISTKCVFLTLFLQIFFPVNNSFHDVLLR